MLELPDLNEQLDRAVAAVRTSEALLIGAGAGMGVDSGLPDFRGPEGFWKAYPPFRGRAFSEISNPQWFRADPSLAWGFFGHRLNLYRETRPHAGFDVLRRWAESMPLGGFVFTSNVDGHFQKAGFREDRIVECHGSIHYLQCADLCTRAIWPAGDTKIEVDSMTIRADSSLPRCPRCQALARPNILMFYDFEWLRPRYDEQLESYRKWLARVRGRRVVAIELGAGTAIPTVRNECERRGHILLRINPIESNTPQGSISIPLGALEALTKMDERLKPHE
jgi:NAD-dependent SIR2 family protein deacetylase